MKNPYALLLSETRSDLAYWQSELAKAKPGSHRENLSRAKVEGCEKRIAEIIAEIGV